jgi:N-acetylneuraminate synthase/N,N'-diacetyllegionaminate synthase
LREHVIVIAEAGVNHNGDIDQAVKLIHAAADAGADYVKFQTFKADNIVSKGAKKAQYQKETTGDSGQYEMLKQLELSEEDHFFLQKQAINRGIKFFSTAFDVDGLDFLFKMGFDRFKVPSGEITNYPYLKRLAEFGKPVIISTGMADMEEIAAAVDVVLSGSLTKKDITVLHCNTQYPTPMEDVNLKAMNTIGRELGVQVGYSDHTLGIEVPIAAVGCGATVIEKHFTLDRQLPGPDHRASLEPDELKAMVSGIRNIELAISGNGIKSPSKSELPNKSIARKSIFVRSSIQKGGQLTEDNLIPLRPGDGINPMEWPELLGRTATKDLEAGHLLTKDDFE